VLTRIRNVRGFQPVIRTIATASYLTLFCAAGISIIRGGMQVGALLVLGGAMGAILNRLQQVSTINEQYQNAIVSARRLWEVLMAPATVPEAPELQALPPGAGSVRFEDVTFGYDPAKPVLHDIRFEVPPGSIVAIVGPTGAGKSTLGQPDRPLLRPAARRVLIDGIDVRDTSLSNLRTQVSFVSRRRTCSATRSPATSRTAGPTSPSARSSRPRGSRRRMTSSST